MMDLQRDVAREIIREKIKETRLLTMDDFAELAKHDMFAQTGYRLYRHGITNKEDMLIRLVFHLIDRERERTGKELQALMTSVAPRTINDYELMKTMKEIQNECGDPNQATALNVFKEEKLK